MLFFAAYKNISVIKFLLLYSRETLSVLSEVEGSKGLVQALSAVEMRFM
jgi:hypothetical protein